jgi:hypothetical protein
MGALGCAALILGLLVAGCGGSGDDEGASRADFVRQANAVCFKANSKAGSSIVSTYDLAKVRESNSESEAIDFEVNLFVPILLKDAESQMEGIAALEVPSGEEEKVEALLGSYKAWVKKADTVPLKIVIANDIYNSAREMAGKMGLDKCEQTPYEEPYTTQSS